MATDNKTKLIEYYAEKILSGDMKTGEKIPTEREIAASFGISKTAVHSALEQLSYMGLIDVYPQSGSFVADYLKTGDARTLDAIARYGVSSLDFERSMSILDIRIAIEGMAFRRICERRTDEDIEVLKAKTQEISEKIDKKISTEELSEDFFRWHREVFIRSKSDMLPLFINALHDISIPFWIIYFKMCGLDGAVKLLYDFIDCIEKHDGDRACALMNDGIDKYLKYISK